MNPHASLSLWQGRGRLTVVLSTGRVHALTRVCYDLNELLPSSGKMAFHGSRGCTRPVS